MNIVNRVTLKTLKKNRTRTIVTVIGVLLSVAMITAVTTFISSMQQTMVNAEILSNGPWHASLDGIPYSAAQKEQTNPRLEKTGIRHGVGYAALEDPLNESKPYLYVEEMDAPAMELYGLRVVSGRLPQAAGEVVVAEHLSENGGMQVAVGDVLTLEIGDRYMTGQEEEGPLGQINGYWPEEVPETLKVRESRTYTVVGIIERPDFENYSAPGYTLVAWLDPAVLSADDPVILPFIAKNAGEAVGLSQSLLEENGLAETAASSLHGDLLDFMGVGDNENFNAVLYNMGAVLIVLIMIGSVSLIYNAFAISVSERFKQFGMLAGIGATSRQIRNSVLFEACFISGIGIPLGLLSGVGGIGLTLYLLRDVLSSFLNSTADFRFVFSVSVPAVVIAALVGFFTVLVSAWIPSRRAARVSPIEAIRMTGEIRIKRRQVKTSRLTRRLFGIEGDLAMKNFKRNRRRYRATVFSLVISIVLFLSASSFTSYMSEGVNSVYSVSNYDLVVGMNSFQEEDRDAVVGAVAGLEEVEDWSVVKCAAGNVCLPADCINPDYLVSQEEGAAPGVSLNEDGTAWLNYYVYGISEEAFRAYLRELGLDEETYTASDSPRGIVLDQQVYYDRAGHLAVSRLFTSLPQEEITLHDSTYDYDTGESSGLESGEVSEAALTLSAVADKAPLGVEAYQSRTDIFSILLPEQTFDALFGRFPDSSRLEDMLSIKAADAAAAETAIKAALQDRGYAGISPINLQEALQTNRNLILVINVFSYGFIALITLITITNVFNTISTNVNLRRREFAMLKSVGMTGGGFNRMINFECLFYGLKALLYGLPLSLLFTYWIHRSMDLGVSLHFRIPWLQVLICVLGVFLIVFITMMYAMSKVRRENIVDALKNENL
ncbi:MAG TPA: ABC transporter permease [Firmicutes bacterium]|nr:ABC transporter permease [Bacillota bacterium]